MAGSSRGDEALRALSPDFRGVSAARVRIGLNLTVQYGQNASPIAALDEQLRLVAAVRDASWDSVYVSQHFLVPEVAHLQPLPLLGRLAAETGQMRIGVGISLLALLNPVDVAEAYATVDVLTGGRLVFGAGLGYRSQELKAFGVDRATRVQRFNANLDLITRLWEGEAVSAELPWCHLDEARLSVLPVQRPRPPVWIAASNDQAVVRAAGYGDAWLIGPHVTMATVERQLRQYTAARAEAGRPEATDVPLMREVVCARSRQLAVDRARRHLGAKYALYERWGQGNALPADEHLDADLSALAHDRFAIGDPGDCLLVLREWIKRIDASELILRVHWPTAPIDEALESVDLLSTEVFPHL